MASIEFAIVVPLLLLLMAAIFELGMGFIQYSTLNKGVRDGARYAAANAQAGSTGVVLLSTPVVTTTRNLVVFGNPGGNGNPSLPGWTTDAVSVTADSEYITVSATYPFQPFVFNVLPAFFGEAQTLGFTLSSAVVVRAL